MTALTGGTQLGFDLADPIDLPDEELWRLLADHDRLARRWDTTRTEPDRRAVQAAWHIPLTAPGGNAEPAELPGWVGRCRPSIVYRDTRLWPPERPWSPAVSGRMEYRGCCLGCGWVADTIHAQANAAVEDAHDHSHPGWADLPIVTRPPSLYAEGTRAQIEKRIDRWCAQVLPLLPDGWAAIRGPIRTLRTSPIGTRHVPYGTPWGGYDISAGVEQEQQR